MRLGYNTNGLAHHRLVDAIDLLADEGYESVAITLDAGALDPYDDAGRLEQESIRVGEILERRGMSCVIETGARFVLNPRLKHDPTLMDADPARRAVRVDFLRRAIDLAARLRADAMSFWSGGLGDAISEEQALDRLVGALQPVIEHAERRDVRLAFEPEPGMFIDTFERFSRLDERVRHPLFDLTVDVGHVFCVEPGSTAERIAPWVSRIANVHIEDMHRNLHEHLMFGEGSMDFPPILETLFRGGYRGGVHVELSRHSHMAVDAVRRSRDFLRAIWPEGALV
ncbi:MAG: sugar phosphate isomerase/epimerase family protein [Isosphaeraceae bacterium]|nr:sugar phosphate isomerase/epimerase family protein [Isosphaeraceae bacterium]